MSELVQILNQGLKNFDQNNRGTIRENFNDFPLKANLKYKINIQVYNIE